MANQIGFSNAMKEVVGNNFVTLNELKNDNEIYFPLFKNNADGTEAKKILGKLIANNSGGGSTPSAQPDRVIIIDTTLTENIEGKAYSTFAAAKTYMEANPTLKFQVELPAGDFDEAVSLSNQWVIQGNNTNLIQALTTVDVTTEEQIPANAEIRIKNCKISGGFVSTAEEGTLSIFYLLSCEVTNISCGETPVVVVGMNNFVDSASNSLAIAVFLYSAIKRCKCYVMNAIGSFFHSTADITAQRSVFDSCNFSEGCKIPSLNIYNSNGYVILNANISSDHSSLISNSIIDIELENGVDTVNVFVRSSDVSIYDSSFTYGIIRASSDSSIYIENSTVPTFGAAANTQILKKDTITTNYQPNYYMYNG